MRREHEEKAQWSKMFSLCSRALRVKFPEGWRTKFWFSVEINPSKTCPNLVGSKGTQDFRICCYFVIIQ